MCNKLKWFLLDILLCKDWLTKTCGILICEILNELGVKTSDKFLSLI